MLIPNIFNPPPVIAAGKWKTGCVAETDVATIQGFECLFENILQVIIPIAGLTFFAMFLVGGFKYLTAGGNPKKAAAATHTITMAFIGIIGVLFSWLILLFIENFTGVGVTNVDFPTPQLYP